MGMTWFRSKIGNEERTPELVIGSVKNDRKIIDNRLNELSAINFDFPLGNEELVSEELALA